jgi:hypothetical protein
MTLATYLAQVTFIEKGGQTEKGYDIYFLAKTINDAACSAFAWARKRQEVLPDFFGPLGCVKLYFFNPEEIKEDGTYESPTSFCVYEWKCDQGKPIPTRKAA